MSAVSWPVLEGPGWDSRSGSQTLPRSSSLSSQSGSQGGGRAFRARAEVGKVSEAWAQKHTFYLSPHPVGWNQSQGVRREMVPEVVRMWVCGSGENRIVFAVTLPHRHLAARYQFGSLSETLSRNLSQILMQGQTLSPWGGHGHRTITLHDTWLTKDRPAWSLEERVPGNINIWWPQHRARYRGVLTDYSTEWFYLMNNANVTIHCFALAAGSLHNRATVLGADFKCGFIWLFWLIFPLAWFNFLLTVISVGNLAISNPSSSEISWK